MNKPCISAFPIEGEGRLLRSGSISRLIIPFTFVPACTFSVYASQWVLPPAHARLDTWLLARRCHDGHLRPLNLLRFKAQPSPMRRPSPLGWHRSENVSGWSMPSAPLQDPRRYWPICRATSHAPPRPTPP